MEKRIVTLYISDRSRNIVKELGSGFNFSHWVDKKIQEELGGLETLYMEKEKKEKEIKNIDNRIALFEKYTKEKEEKVQELKETISDTEKRFLKESKKILKRDPTFLDGRINLYKNEFGKRSISKTDFLELLEVIE